MTLMILMLVLLVLVMVLVMMLLVLMMLVLVLMMVMMVMMMNLSPAAPVTLRCLHRSEDQNDWEALRKKHVDTPMVMVISVYGGHLVAGGFGGLPPLASVVVERWYMAPGVKRVEVAERGVTGTFFIPAGPGPYPGVLDIWGGGGWWSTAPRC
ncbi:hypothetical protein CRUP_037841 [Coryphaenoides rupestris]|nr:hypothetical protein CRUP_037841 [Coryphaenoides rupestris]